MIYNFKVEVTRIAHECPSPAMSVEIETTQNEPDEPQTDEIKNTTQEMTEERNCNFLI